MRCIIYNFSINIFYYIVENINSSVNSSKCSISAQLFGSLWPLMFLFSFIISMHLPYYAAFLLSLRFCCHPFVISIIYIFKTSVISGSMWDDISYTLVFWHFWCMLGSCIWSPTIYSKNKNRKIKSSSIIIQTSRSNHQSFLVNTHQV